MDEYIEHVMGVRLRRVHEIMTFLKSQADQEEIKNRMAADDQDQFNHFLKV